MKTFKVELKATDSIRPYDRNPRQNDQAVDAVAASLSEFGFRQPIVVDDDGVIICGHTRYKAAVKLGLERVPVHIAKGLSPEQVKAYRIADNKTGELAEWDMEILPIELGELRDAGFAMDLLAFGEDELAGLLDGGDEVTPGQTDPDQVPEPPDEAISVRGEVYQLGGHRLMCGDSGSEPDLDLLLDGAVIDLCDMDPPYNVKVEPRSNNAIAAGMSSFPAGAGGKPGKLTHHQAFDLARGATKAKATHKKLRPKDRPLENDFISAGDFDQLLLAWFGNASRVLKAGGPFYIWGGYSNVRDYPQAILASGLYLAQVLVWDKQHPVMTRKDFMGAHESAFYGWKEGAAHCYYGPHNATDLWHVKKVNPQSMIHLTEKPVELAVMAIQYSSRKGENVLDLFGGSGSTLIGCEQTGRKAFLMEHDQLYCDVIRKRWAEFVHGEGCDWQKLTPVVATTSQEAG